MAATRVDIPAGLVRFGVFELNLQSAELRKSGMKLRLEGQPMQLLALLLRRSGEVVTREEIRRELWPADTFVDFDHGINTSMKRLRQALNDCPDTPRFIETLPRRGYRFIYPVIDHRANHSGNGSTKVSSLAVLPLDNLSGDERQDYFADGVTEELITALSKITAVKVTSRSSVMQYKGQRQSVREIGRELDVDAVIEGSVARKGRRVRITVQLIDAAADRHLWSERYERDVTSVLAMQGDIARQIAREIRIQLSPQEEIRLSQGGPVNPAAYELFLKARFFLAKWAKRGSLAKAIDLYDAAIRTDPYFASAYAGRSMAHLYRAAALMEEVPPAEVVQRARQDGNQALQLDPELAEGYEALGWLAGNHIWDWEEAERALRRALELNPSYAPPHVWLGHYLNVLRRHEEALALMQRARQLDPLSPHVQWAIAETYVIVGELDKAAELCREGLHMHPDFWPFHVLMGDIHLRDGGYEEAIASRRRAVALSGRHGYTLGKLGAAYALAGHVAEARGVLEELTKRSRSAYISPMAMVRVHAALGDTGQALDWLQRACEERSGETPRVPLWGPEAGDITSHPGWHDLARRMGLSH